MNRKAKISYYQQKPQLSVLIMGAGINGIGTFRDLALQGVDVLLVDRQDYCAGASAASSHMVHGGIRYLENGEFRLVREAIQERNRLLQNAPHAVMPLATNIPIFKWFSGLLNAPLKFLNLLNKPNERGVLVIKLGLMLYDAYTRLQKTVPSHQFMGKLDALEKYPALNPNIIALATYYDGLMSSPERLALELVLDGETAYEKAHALNYVSVVDAKDNQVTLQDKETNQTFTVQPKLVINATGPWIDLVNQRLGHPTRFIGGTKGSHIIVKNPKLKKMIGDHEFFFENEDGRIVLICPLLNKVMIGTSDMRIDNPDQAHCTDDEVQYFLELSQRLFPNISVKPEQIVYRFAGVRPLPASNAGTTGQISRDHHNHIIPPQDSPFTFPIFNLVGGKWTTFRAFAEQATDQALVHLQRSRQKTTRDLPIGGGHNYPKTITDRQEWIDALTTQQNIDIKRAHTLFTRYGTRSLAVAQYINLDADEMLQHHDTYSKREIMFIAEHEQVQHLTDLLQRRSLLAMLGELTYGLIMEIADIIAPLLNWSDDKQQAEIEHTLHILSEQHQVHFKYP